MSQNRFSLDIVGSGKLPSTMSEKEALQQLPPIQRDFRSAVKRWNPVAAGREGEMNDPST